MNITFDIEDDIFEHDISDHGIPDEHLYNEINPNLKDNGNLQTNYDDESTQEYDNVRALESFDKNVS